MVTIGVVSDTHVPDRARHVNPAVFHVFRESGVDEILHAGDVSVPRVLEKLSRIAPVRAVRGNRDWYALGGLPSSRRLEYEGVEVVLTHGHGSLRRYLVERVNFLVRGYQYERYGPYLARTYPTAGVIIFGHTHVAVNRRADGKLIFNPGSAHLPEDKKLSPSVGLLRFMTGGEVRGEIVWLD